MINNSEVYHDVKMVLPELSKGEICVLRHLKAAAKQVLGVQLLKIRNHSFIVGLQNRSDVGW